jgi:hypothetical protein
MSAGTFQVKAPLFSMLAASIVSKGVLWVEGGLLMSGLTSNGFALVQGIAGTAPEEDGDGTLSGGLPGEVDGLAGRGVQASCGNVEGVGSVGFLSEGEKGRGGDGQEGGSGETHVDD